MPDILEKNLPYFIETRAYGEKFLVNGRSVVVWISKEIRNKIVGG